MLTAGRSAAVDGGPHLLRTIVGDQAANLCCFKQSIAHLLLVEGATGDQLEQAGIEHPLGLRRVGHSQDDEVRKRQQTIELLRTMQLADAVDHPLHLGVTEAGPLPGGIIKATAGIATLLAEGIGDTIR